MFFSPKYNIRSTKDSELFAAKLNQHPKNKRKVISANRIFSLSNSSYNNSTSNNKTNRLAMTTSINKSINKSHNNKKFLNEKSKKNYNHHRSNSCKMVASKKNDFNIFNNKIMKRNLRSKISFTPINIFEKYKNKKNKKSPLYLEQIIINKNSYFENEKKINDKKNKDNKVIDINKNIFSNKNNKNNKNKNNKNDKINKNNTYSQTIENKNNHKKNISNINKNGNFTKTFILETNGEENKNKEIKNIYNKTRNNNKNTANQNNITNYKNITNNKNITENKTPIFQISKQNNIYFKNAYPKVLNNNNNSKIFDFNIKPKNNSNLQISRSDLNILSTTSLLSKTDILLNNIVPSSSVACNNRKNLNSSFNYEESSFNNNNTIIKKIKSIHDISKTGISGEEKKVNQDRYFIFHNFMNNTENIYMGVCDGHGFYGHEISEYIKENLPMDLNHMLRNIKINNKEILNEIICKTFEMENNSLSRNKQINSTLSGSTCVSVIYTPEKLIIANLGDSRCILGKFINNEWKSESLSKDHKPNVLEEAERIKNAGGRIRPMKNQDGEFVGPLRVYLKEDDIPGLAMTRSFGDLYATTAGTICIPEITEHVFCKEDKFIILGSDGLFEFISNEDIVNIVKKYYNNNDIVGCCEFLYKESYRKWIVEEEDCVDDITIIIVFFEE